MFLNAATIGLVMSFANPHKGNNKVTRMNGTNMARGTTGAEFFDIGIMGC
jgi:hypothetical protein